MLDVMDGETEVEAGSESVALAQVRRLADELARAENPRVRMHAARDLAVVADALQRETASAARERGHTWAEIATWAGITKQAAQQRWSPHR